VSAVANDGSTTTVTCDNTYLDFGWENVARIKKDMYVEIYSAAGSQRSLNSLGYAPVTAVTFGSRANSTSTTGTFTYASAGTDSIADGDIVYIYGSHSSGVHESEYAVGHTDNVCLPIGLTGIVQSAAADYLVDSATDYKLTTWQKVTRSSYATQLAYQYDAADFASGGAAGTPDEWDLSVITDMISDGYRNSGKYIDTIMCSSHLAQCMHRLMRSEGGVNVVVSSTGGINQKIVGSETAKTFIRPDGAEIPIIVSDTIPRNVIYGLCTEDLFWLTMGDYDDLAPRLTGTGGTWMKSPNDRKTNFEAPFGGYSNIAAEACNSSFVALDLRDNL
jgi:hypothetical protein